MLLSAVSVLVVAQSNSKIPEGLMKTLYLMLSTQSKQKYLTNTNKLSVSGIIYVTLVVDEPS